MSTLFFIFVVYRDKFYNFIDLKLTEKHTLPDN